MSRYDPQRDTPTAYEMIDFPVSWGAWRDYCQYFDGFDPGDNEAPEETSPVEKAEWRSIIQPIKERVIRIPIGRQEWDRISQLERQAEYLQKKIVSLEGAIKKKKQGIPEGYDGY